MSDELDLFDVILNEDRSKSLGFTIKGGVSTPEGPMGIFIAKIFPDGQAARQGILKVNDEIISVNGFTVEGCTRKRIAIEINKNKGNLILKIRRINNFDT